MKGALAQVAAISVKELRHLLRDRFTIGMVVMIPVIQLLLFGYAINTDVRHIRASVYDEAGSAWSRQVVQRMTASQVLDIVAGARTLTELEAQLTANVASVGIVIPSDVERRAQQRRPAVQLLVDGSDPLVTSAVQQLRFLPTGTRGDPQPGILPREIEVRIYYNPEMRSAVNTVPGLIGVILTITMVVFTSIAIVRERERGNLELLIVTPITRLQLMVGKVLPYAAIGLVQMTLVLGIGKIVFDVPVSGSLLHAYLATLIFIVASLTVGLVVSTIARTQLQAMQMSFFFIIPSILMSGFMFPFAAMPRPAQWLAEVLPMTHFVRLIRGIILRGAEIQQLWPEILALLAIAAVTLAFATFRFHKHLD